MSKNYLEAFVIVIIAGSLGFFLAWPKYSEVQDISRQIEEKKAEIKNSNEYYANLRQVLGELDERQEELGKIDTAFPKHADAPALIDFIQNAAIQSGVVLKKADYQASGSSASAKGALAASAALSLQSYGILISASADYADFKNFISRFEHSSRLVNISAVSVNANEIVSAANQTQKTIIKDENGRIFNYEIKLTANYYK